MMGFSAMRSFDKIADSIFSIALSMSAIERKRSNRLLDQVSIKSRMLRGLNIDASIDYSYLSIRWTCRNLKNIIPHPASIPNDLRNKTYKNNNNLEIVKTLLQYTRERKR